MANLKTTFAGLELKNPVIAASSGFTASPERCKKLEEAGVAAIVLKSIFEEQIAEQTQNWLGDDLGEAADSLAAYVRGDVLNTYINLIKSVKAAVSIPVIASICCSRLGEWSSFAKVIEDAGADAIELNIMSVCTDKEYVYGSFEEQQVDIYSAVKAAVNIPVVIKLGQGLTNPVATVNSFYAHGARDIVLFNRHYQTDIDIENIKPVSGEVCSTPADICERLRWTAICSALIPSVNFAISGGVHSGSDVVKALLVGAQTVEVCSALYKKGATAVSEMLSGIEDWMNRHGYDSVEQFRGKLNAGNISDETSFERTQFFAAVHSNHYNIEY